MHFIALEIMLLGFKILNYIYNTFVILHYDKTCWID